MNNKETQKELFSFFLLTFLWSWALNIPRVLDSREMINLPNWYGFPAGTLAVFGPMMAAFWLTLRKEGKSGLKELWLRGWKPNFKKSWLWAAILIFPILSILTSIIFLLLGNQFSWEYGLPPAMIVPVFLIIYLLNSLPEEYGWRGYALGRLQMCWNALQSSLILGVIWSLWHLPLHFILGTTQSAIPVWQFFLQTTLVSVLYTWLFNNTAGSILIVTIFHTMSNFSSALLPYWVENSGRWINFILLLIVTLFVILKYGMEKLKKE